MSQSAFSYYGLTTNPFTKDHPYTFKSTDYLEMHARLDQVVSQKGIGLYTGASGVGKSRIVHHFLNGLNTNLYTCCEIKETRLSSRDFYQELAIELGLEPSHKKVVNFRNIQERIRQLESQRITPVIVLDEAQFLSMDIFEELLLLLNFQRDTVSNTVVLLIGTASLLDKLRYASLEALRQRVISIYHCTGIQQDEARQYVEAKLKSAEGSLRVFDENALTSLISHAQGSLRRLDLLTTKVLEIGVKQQQVQITLSLIESATAEILF